MPPLGFIRVQDRTPEQQAAHAAAMGRMVAYSLPVPRLAKGESVRLFDAWADPDVVADVGFIFTRFHQLTGSCVGAGGGNALFSTIAAQRIAADNPTVAFLPFWLGPYAVSRHLYGWDTPGEGSMGSTFAQALTTTGIRDWKSGVDNLPAYTGADGIAVKSRSVEFQWSSYRNPALPAVLEASRPHLIGSAAVCRTTDDIRAMIGNGYGVTFACDRYIGNASVMSGGGTAYVAGYWDSDGGHQQSIHAVWEHPNDGPLFWVQNNWPGDTYPQDPAGGPVCGCWVSETNVQRALSYSAEVYGLSHLNWFPTQPKVLDWATI